MGVRLGVGRDEQLFDEKGEGRGAGVAERLIRGGRLHEQRLVGARGERRSHILDERRAAVGLGERAGEEGMDVARDGDQVGHGGEPLDQRGAARGHAVPVFDGEEELLLEVVGEPEAGHVDHALLQREGVGPDLPGGIRAGESVDEPLLLGAAVRLLGLGCGAVEQVADEEVGLLAGEVAGADLTEEAALAGVVDGEAAGQAGQLGGVGRDGEVDAAGVRRDAAL